MDYRSQLLFCFLDRAKGEWIYFCAIQNEPFSSSSYHLLKRKSVTEKSFNFLSVRCTHLRSAHCLAMYVCVYIGSVDRAWNTKHTNKSIYSNIHLCRIYRVSTLCNVSISFTVAKIISLKYSSILLDSIFRTLSISTFEQEKKTLASKCMASSSCFRFWSSEHQNSAQNTEQNSMRLANSKRNGGVCAYSLREANEKLCMRSMLRYLCVYFQYEFLAGRIKLCYEIMLRAIFPDW